VVTPTKQSWEPRDLLFNSDLKLKIKATVPHQALLQSELDIAALAIGHNPSISLEEKRYFMVGVKRFLQRNAALGPPENGLNIFKRDPNHNGAAAL